MTRFISPTCELQERPGLPLKRRPQLLALRVSNQLFLISCAHAGASASKDQRRRSKAAVGTTLWNHYTRMVAPRVSSDGETSTVCLVEGVWGRPRLLINGIEGPSISFTHDEFITWGALAAPGLGIGIDSATSSEFGSTYPLRRAFHEQELEYISHVDCEDSREIAALIWSAKEAAVKALGCGFHLVDPAEVRVQPMTDPRGGFKAEHREIVAVRQEWTQQTEVLIEVHSFRHSRGWLSLALFSGFRRGEEASCWDAGGL